MKYVVIQDDWLPEPFDTVEEASAYKKALQQLADAIGMVTNIKVYEKILT